MNQIPRAEHPRPDFMRPDWLNLNGQWEFSFDDANVGVTEHWFMPGHHLAGEITVPFCYQCEMSGINDQSKHPVMWYRRSFEVPASMAGKQVLIRFGAVDYACDVYVNGQCIGSHEGGYTPFSVNATPFLQAGENDLCLRVEDYPDCTQPRGKQNWLDEPFECWYTPVSGIWQTVYLEAVGNPYLLSAHIQPDLDAGTATLTLTLDSIPQTSVDAQITVTLKGEEVVRQTMSMNQRTQRVIMDMVSGANVWGFKRWTPKSPTLYDVKIVLSSGDEVSTYFGMRSIEVKDGWILLNKKPLYQRLILDQGYWPESLLTPPSDEAIRTDIEWTLKLGYNGARKHQKVEDPRYYYWADKMGLLVWGEVPSAYEYTGKTAANLSRTFAEFIDRDFNHPSLIVWVPLNESWGVERIYRDKQMQGCASMLYHQAKAMDGARIVSTNDGWEHTQTDILGLHDYAAYGDVLGKHFADREVLNTHTNWHHMSYVEGAVPSSKEAVMLTEYGGIAFDEGGEETWGYHGKVKDEEMFFARYQSLTEAARAIPYCQGYCYTQLTDVHQEINGVLTADRKPKVDPERFARITINPEGRY